MTDKAMPELKPCPFCAGDYRHITIDYDDNDPRYAIGCNQCLAEIFPQDTIEKAIAVWNTRPHQEADQADGLHSKIDMDIEDAIGRELTLEESRIVGLAILGAQQPEKPQWWKDVEWLAELRKPKTGAQSPPPDERSCPRCNYPEPLKSEVSKPVPYQPDERIEGQDCIGEYPDAVMVKIHPITGPELIPFGGVTYKKAQPINPEKSKYSLDDLEECLALIQLDTKEEEICECLNGACEEALQFYIAARAHSRRTEKEEVCKKCNGEGWHHYNGPQGETGDRVFCKCSIGQSRRQNQEGNDGKL